MCTVVTRLEAGEPLRILAIRDEFVSRDFDGPGAWWPEQPTVVGGRDRLAGGTWCASDVSSGRTALVLNRIERRVGRPSRGVLPLAALAHGAAWTEHVDVREMAGFNLVLATPDGVSVWSWNAAALTRADLPTGTHVVTSSGVDADDPKTVAYAPRLGREPWVDVVTSSPPSADPTALIVSRPVEGDTYATVFGQLITSTPGSLLVSHSRTPWQAGTCTEQRWP
jgi:uncharacterized protein with NRDE domain